MQIKGTCQLLESVTIITSIDDWDNIQYVRIPHIKPSALFIVFAAYLLSILTLCVFMCVSFYPISRSGARNKEANKRILKHYSPLFIVSISLIGFQIPAELYTHSHSEDFHMIIHTEE